MIFHRQALSFLKTLNVVPLRYYCVACTVWLKDVCSWRENEKGACVRLKV